MRTGKFQHPAIIDGLKYIYFGNKKRFGNVSPCEDMVALGETLTAEAVAWICIAV